MGGYGSTRWRGHVSKATIEETCALNIFRLRRDGIVIPMAHHTGVLSAGVVRIRFQLADNQLSLSYVASGHAIRDIIQIVETRPNFGGVRLWWLCPGCDRRVGKLYFVAAVFRCRHCSELAYQSTREQTTKKVYDTLQASERRIENRINRVQKMLKNGQSSR